MAYFKPMYSFQFSEVKLRSTKEDKIMNKIIFTRDNHRELNEITCCDKEGF